MTASRPAEAVHPLEPRTAAVPAAVTFEGFAIELLSTLSPDEARVRLAPALPGWRIEPFGDRPTDLEALPPAGESLGQRDAWDLAYQIRAVPGVVYAEPLFVVPLPDEDPGAGPAPDVPGAAWTAAEHLPESDPLEWSLRQLHVPEVWDTWFGGDPGRAGAGVIVGHPDTGYRRHPEIAGNVDAALGYDFLKDDPDATDELERPDGELLPNPGHGTSTASVIVSPRGPAGGGTAAGVSGVAPGARIMPLRVTHSVVLLSMRNLARAIEFAADRGAHVLSISLGGPFNWRLRRAVAYAQQRGVLVCCAAGNYVPFVVWPAAYAEVIAVAASNATRGVWRGSSRGSAVDVTAPGESVWRARSVPVPPGAPPGDEFLVERGSGTSYAVAAVAGVAALWLSRHGRDALVERYGAEKPPFVFNEVLRAGCDPMPGWEPGKFGAGLVDARKVLDAPLPDQFVVQSVAAARAFEGHPSLDAGTLTTFAHLFEQEVAPPGPSATAADLAPLDRVRDALAAVLGIDPGELPRRLNDVGQELAFRFAVDPELHAQFAALLTPPAAATAEDVGFDVRLRMLRHEIGVAGSSASLGTLLRDADRQMAGGGLSGFALHTWDPDDANAHAAAAFTPPTPVGARDGAKPDPETAARGYLGQTLASPDIANLTAESVGGSAGGLKLLGVETLPLTQSVSVKFRQYVHQLPVYGSLVTVELDEESRLLSLNSSLGAPKDVDPVATVAPGDALRTVAAAAGYAADQRPAKLPRLVVYFDAAVGRWRLTYVVEDVPTVAGDAGAAGAERAPARGALPPRVRDAAARQPGIPAVYDYFVDAHTGELVAKLPRAASVADHGAVAGEPPPDGTVMSIERPDVLGRPRAIPVERIGGVWRLRDRELNVETFDFNLGDWQRERAGLPGAPAAEPPDVSPAAVSAHANAREVARFLRERLARNGLDNLGEGIRSSINCVDGRDRREWKNAAWIGTQIIYGQRVVRGDNGADELRSYAAALDIAAHEVFHGVTERTARLQYAGESGALNESYSDIFGVIISNAAVGSRAAWNWTIGEELSDTGVPLRDLSDPTRYGQPARMSEYRHWPVSPYYDWGGLHVNSGIHNYAAYRILTAERPGGAPGAYWFTPDEVAVMFYIALTQHLSRTSRFADSRRGVRLAARSLFRMQPDVQERVQAIDAAFDAAEIVLPA